VRTRAFFSSSYRRRGSRSAFSYYLTNLIAIRSHHHCRGLPYIQRGLGALSHPEILPRPRGGFVPYQAGRFVHGWQVVRNPRRSSPSPPTDSLKRSIFDTSCTRRTSRIPRRRCGADRCCRQRLSVRMGMPDGVLQVRGLPIGATEQHPYSARRQHCLVPSPPRPRPRAVG